METGKDLPNYMPSYPPPIFEVEAEARAMEAALLEHRRAAKRKNKRKQAKASRKYNRKGKK